MSTRLLVSVIRKPLHCNPRFLALYKMDNLPPAKPGARAASSFVTDKAYVNGEWVKAKSGKSYEGTLDGQV